MFLGHLKHITKTVGFRLTLWYFTILISSSVLLFGLTYFLLSASLEKQDKNAIELKLEEFSGLYMAEGMAALKKEVAVQKKFEKNPSFLVRLAGPQSKTQLLILPYQWMQFDIEALERVKPFESSTWSYLPLQDHGYQLEVLSMPLGGGYLLQVGKTTEIRERMLNHFRETFGLVMFPLILLGFIGGTVVARRALGPIRHLIKTVRSIDAGKMDARVLRPQTGDELDELVMLFNGMLTKIESLINGMKDSLDNVAHDLRTPMARLRGIAEMALQSDQGEDSLRDALADSLEESEHILTMLNALMDISEAETGAMKLDLSPINAASLIEGVVELYRYVAEDKGIVVQAEVPSALCLVGDPMRLGQVLGNLLDNAIKYTPKGGRVDIEVHQSQKGVVISVRDTGIGISPEERPRIWDRLYRGDQSRSQRGLGLGLSMVKAIVQAHNGEVEALSEPGKGSTFRITFPS
jgi:signal transduction histidine kinase